VPVSYSNDLRERVVARYKQGGISLVDVAEQFDVCRNTAINWLARKERTGSVEPGKSGGCRVPPKLSREQVNLLCMIAGEHPALTLGDYRELLEKACGVKASESTVGRALRREGITRKRLMIHASQRLTMRVQALEVEFRSTIQPEINGAKTITIDETGGNLAMTALYGWSPLGTRAEGFAPHRSRNLTTVYGLTMDGPVEPLVIEGGMTGEVFKTYLRERIAPRIGRGWTVVFDNLSAHHVAGVREIIEATGARLVYTPPYWPEFNPIEYSISKLKQYLRSVAPRTWEEYIQAVADGLRSITAEDCRGYFTHSGYHAKAA